MNSNKDFIDMIQKYSDDRNLSNIFILEEISKYDNNKLKFINDISISLYDEENKVEQTMRNHIIRSSTLFFEDVKSVLKIIFHPINKLKIECILNTRTNFGCFITVDTNNIIFSYGSKYEERSNFDITDIFNMDFNDPSFDDKVKESYLLYKLEYTSIFDITGAGKAII